MCVCVWGGGGGALAGLFVVTHIGFMPKSEPNLGPGHPRLRLAISRGTILPVFIVDRLALSRLVTSSRSLGCCRSKT